jgi:hypothetical protein
MKETQLNVTRQSKQTESINELIKKKTEHNMGHKLEEMLRNCPPTAHGRKDKGKAK